MPRASRYLLPGYTYHITHRCADRQFLLRFARDRDVYREWLRIAVARHGVPVYAYTVTSNHAHLVVHADDTESVARLMQLLSSATAKQYNRRKDRTGPFWEDRYHCTIIQDGTYLWNCLRYVDLNMVRAGVVSHPSRWPWCGYAELAGLRQRYRILNVERLLNSLGGGDVEGFRAAYVGDIDKSASNLAQKRELAWTESLAVGSREFVESVQSHYTWRRQFRLETGTDATGNRVWMLREMPTAYGTVPHQKTTNKVDHGERFRRNPVYANNLSWSDDANSGCSY